MFESLTRYLFKIIESPNYGKISSFNYSNQMLFSNVLAQVPS